MHITGKLLLFVLLIPLAATAVWMSARLYVVRNSWSQQVDVLAEDNINSEKQLKVNQKKLDGLRNELARTMLPWVRHWDNVNARGAVDNSGKLTLSAQFGTGQGITGRSANPVMYVFRPDADGKYSYLGSYRATTVRPQQSALESTWKYRPSDTLDLKLGKWRFRSMIPSGYTNRIAQLNTQLASSDVKLKDYSISDAAQTKLIKETDEALQTRRGELLGDPSVKEVPGSPETHLGFVAVIESEQNARNKVLIELDNIRRQVKAEHDKMVRLIQENRELASQLSEDGATTVKQTAIKEAAGSN